MMIRVFLGVSTLFVFGALATSLLETHVGLPAPLLDEAVSQKFFWESPGYVKAVAMAWYPALPAWLSVPIFPIAGPTFLPIAMGALAFALVAAGLYQLGTQMKRDGVPRLIRAATLVTLATLQFYLTARFGSLYSTSLFALVILCAAALGRVGDQITLTGISLLALALILLPMHSFEGAALAGFTLGIASIGLLLDRNPSDQKRIYVVFLASSVAVGLLIIVYLQGFFGVGPQALMRDYLLDLAHRQVPALAVVFAKGWGIMLFGVGILVMASLVAVYRAPGLLRTVSMSALAVLTTVWTLPNTAHQSPKRTPQLSSLISQPLVQPDATILVEPETMPTELVFSRDLGGLTFPYNEAFRATQAGVILPGTYLLRRKTPAPDAKHHRLSAFLARYPHVLIAQSDDWAVFKLTPQEEPS